MKIEHVKRALWVPGLNPGERLLLATLTDHASPERGVFLARDTLVRLTELHPKTIQLHLRRLLSLGYLEETAHAKPGQVRTFMPHPERWPRPSFEDTPNPDTQAPGGHDPPPPGEAPPSAPPPTLEATLGSALKAV